MTGPITWKHWLGIAAVLLAAACPVCCWVPARNWKGDMNAD